MLMPVLSVLQKVAAMTAQLVWVAVVMEASQVMAPQARPLKSKVFTKIQRFIYKDLLLQHDLTCPDGMTMEDVSRQCFPVACYGAMIMHHVYGLKKPTVILGDCLLHDGEVKVHGCPHSMVYYRGWYIDFSDLTRNIQYPETEIVWDLSTARNLIEKGGDQVLAWLEIDSMYSVESCSILYSGALESIKKWRTSSATTKQKPRILQLDRGGYEGGMGEYPDPRTIKRIGFNDNVHKVLR